MKIHIDKVAEEDYELWIDWRMRVISVVFEGDPAQDGSVGLIDLRNANAEYFHQGMRNGTFTACFARAEDGTILGCGGSCTLRELPSPDNPSGLVSYIMNIFVVPEGRGSGVGAQIVQWLLDDSCSRGITRIMLESTDEGRDLYLKMGFKDTVGYMILDRRECALAAAQEDAPTEQKGTASADEAVPLTKQD